MAATLTGRVRGATKRWLVGRDEPEAGEVFLHRRRVFIVPTGAGIGFGVLLLVLLIGSINYNLGLGFGLTFTAAACAVADLYLTWRNLAHLHLRAGRVADVFAGDEVQFELHIANRSTLDRYALQVGLADGDEAPHAADVAAGASATVLLALPSSRRGWLGAPRMRLSTRFPLGLFRAWSYWRPDSRALVWPAPEHNAPPLPLAGQAAASGSGQAGHDDFAGVRSYQPGDPMRHLAWRQIARLDQADGGQLATKHFEGGASDELVLDFDALPGGLGVEQRLSRLARWVQVAEGRALPYAFRLGAQRFDSASGAAHQAACLRALALYPGVAP